ncbi:unnamed protein product [Lota lota]
MRSRCRWGVSEERNVPQQHGAPGPRCEYGGALPSQLSAPPPEPMTLRGLGLMWLEKSPGSERPYMKPGPRPFVSHACCWRRPEDHLLMGLLHTNTPGPEGAPARPAGRQLKAWARTAGGEPQGIPDRFPPAASGAPSLFSSLPSPPPLVSRFSPGGEMLFEPVLPEQTPSQEASCEKYDVVNQQGLTQAEAAVRDDVHQSPEAAAVVKQCSEGSPSRRTAPQRPSGGTETLDAHAVFSN